ncbi:MAG: hypothetical protein JW843_02950 [Candidatus Aminicenantes bacterium]|nr:hypothetical protein [Candidatus Aminicenantes bacterium]
MKNAVYKILPIAVGLSLGWILFHPPAWIPSGPAGTIIIAAAVFVLLVGFIAVNIATSLPAEIKLQPLGGPPDPAIEYLSRELGALGFEEAGGPFLVGIRPAAVLTAFVHPGERVYASVFRTGTVPAVTSYDFVSILEGRPAGLTTTSNWRGGTVPAGPGEFRQVLPAAGVRQAFETHLKGLAWLQSRNLRVKKVSAASFAADFLEALGIQREHYRRTALRSAFVALGRTLIKRSPEHGPLAGQRGIEEKLRRVRSQV